MKKCKPLLSLTLSIVFIISAVVSAQDNAKQNKPEMLKKLESIQKQISNDTENKKSDQKIPQKKQNDQGIPNIKFENPIRDLGQVGPNTKHTFKYKFKNTGDGVLKINKTHAPCSCTIPNLKKKEFKPGEQGEIDVRFDAPKTASNISKYLYIYSNDPDNQKYELKIQGKVVLKVEAKPKLLELNLGKENAGAQDIVLNSKDGKEFSVTSVEDRYKVADFKFDKDKKSTRIKVTPEFDKEKLKNRLNGVFTINLDHPNCKTVVIRYTTPPAFVVEPRAIIQTSATPGKGYKRTLWVTSNYSDKLEIESVSSEKGTVEVLSQQSYGNRYKIDVELNGPDNENPKRRFHSDTLNIKIKDGKNLTVRCQQWYPRN